MDERWLRRLRRRDLLRMGGAGAAAAAFLQACGPAATPAAPTSAATAAVAPAPTTAPPTAAPKAAKTFAIRFGAGSNAATPQGKASAYFAQELGKRSNGAVTATYFPDGQIGNPRDLLEGLRLGTVQMAEVSTANITAFLSDTLVFDMPYVFAGSEQLLKFLDGPAGRRTLGVERFGTVGFRALAWLDQGSRSLFNSKRAVANPSDMKGLKVRVEENPVRVAALNAMGAQATPMAFGEVYGALQQKVVDGAEGPPPVILAQKFNEVTQYLSLTEHFTTPGVFVMSKKFFDELSPDLQAIVEKVARDAEALERKIWAEESATTLQALEKAGMKINQVDKAAFQRTVDGVIKEYTAKVDKAWLDVVMAQR